MKSGTTQRLYAVAAVRTGAWAVGAEGTTLRWDGDAWTKVAAPTAKDLTRVRMGEDGSAWAFGDRVALRWTGAAWELEAPVGPKTHLKDVLPVSADLAWGVSAAVDGTCLWTWNGSIWQPVRLDTLGPCALGHIWGTADDFWVASDGARDFARVRRSGDELQATTPTVEGVYYQYVWRGITGAGPDAPWLLAGSSSSEEIEAIYAWNGVSHVELPRVHAFADVQDVFVLASDRAFAVTELGGIFAFDGEEWHENLAPDFDSVVLRGIAGTRASTLWAVGDEGVILQPK